MSIQRQNPDGSWSDSEPLPLTCEHTRVVRFLRRLVGAYGSGECCDGDMVDQRDGTRW